MAAPVLSLRGVEKSFGKTAIIRGVDLDIDRGSVHAIIGPNGAGKSTLFNLITGLQQVSGGRIELNGREIQNRLPHDISRRGLSRSFQVTNIFDNMSVAENIRCGAMWAAGLGYSFWKLVSRQAALNRRVDEVLEVTGLDSRRNVPAGLLSYSDQRALEIAITLANNADVILLDEPTAGMSRSETRAAIELIRTIARDRTVVIVEHDMGVVFDLATTISVLVYGQIIATGPPRQIRADPSVQEAYLGPEPEAEADA